MPDGISPCSCERSIHEQRRVVLTGGPGAGKTAVLEIVKRHLCRHVSVLPEAAGIVFSGGFWRRPSMSAQRAAQRAIFHIQREMERLVEEEGDTAIAFCDRGTLDGLAYWPDPAELFYSELEIDRKVEMSRYSTVIHLRTPSAEQGYNRGNPVRIESPREAAAIDRRIERAWNGHPRRFFVESSEDFLVKVRRTLELLRGELPECCAQCTSPPLDWRKPVQLRLRSKV